MPFPDQLLEDRLRGVLIRYTVRSHYRAVSTVKAPRYAVFRAGELCSEPMDHASAREMARELTLADVMAAVREVKGALSSPLGARAWQLATEEIEALPAPAAVAVEPAPPTASTARPPRGGFKGGWCSQCDRMVTALCVAKCKDRFCSYSGIA